MSIAPGEKMLGAHVDEALVERLSKQVDKLGLKNKRVIAAAVELWLSLPDTVQVALMHNETGTKSLADLVQKIVDEYMAGKIRESSQ